MRYEEFITKALHGRSVNKAAQEMGIDQSKLNKYKLGHNLPGFMTAMILAREAGVSAEEAMRTLAEEEARRKGILEQAKQLFLCLLNAPKKGVSLAC